MQDQDKLYRSEDGVVGGVCAGVAQRLDLDDALVRIAMLLLSLVTFGLGALAYAVAWLVLPLAPVSAQAVEVDPQDFRSEIYEQVVLGSPSPAAAADASLRSVASVPPVPPPGASFGAAAGPLPAGSVLQPASGQGAQRQLGFIIAGMVCGLGLMVFGAAALFSNVTGRSSITQYWPLLLVAAGVMRLAVPGRDGSRGLTAWLGAFILFAGLVLLASTLGFYSLDLQSWMESAGPLLLVAAGLFVVGKASHSNLFVLGAWLALALFCIVGVLSGTGTGALEELGASLPFGLDELVFKGLGL